MRWLLMLCLILGILPTSVLAQTPTVHWASYAYDVVVQRNGDLLFTETQELVVDSGTLRKGRLQFNTGADGRVRQIEVREGSQRYNRSDTGQPGTFNGTDNGQQAVIDYVFQDSGASRHTLTISYIVSQVLRGSQDQAALRWNFFCGSASCPRIDATRLTVNFGQAVAPSALNVTAAGFDAAQTITDQGVQWTAQQPVQGQQLAINLTFPAALVPDATFAPAIQAPAQQPQGVPQTNAPQPFSINISPFFCAAVLFILIVVWSMSRSGRRRTQAIPFGGPSINPLPRGRRRRRQRGGWGGSFGGPFGGWGGGWGGGYGIPQDRESRPAEPLDSGGQSWSDSGGGGTAWSDSGGGGSAWSDSGSGGGSFADFGGGGSSFGDSGSSSGGSDSGGGGSDNNSSFG